GLAVEGEQIHDVHAGGFALGEKGTRFVAQDTGRRQSEAGELFRIDTLFVWRGRDDEMDAARGELVAEVNHGGECIARSRITRLPALGEEADARLIEEPAVAPDNRLLSRVAQGEVLRGLHP